MTVADRVLRVMSRTLNIDVPPGKDFCRDAVPAWDSLKHVELIFALEEEFDVQFSEAAMQELVSFDAIVRMVRKLTNPELPDAP